MNTFSRFSLSALGLLAILVLTLIAFHLPLLESLRLLSHGAFGDKFGWSRTAVKSIPLLLTGLGMVVAWRAGMYNIGGEGQFVVGGVLGCVVAKAMLKAASLPPFLVTIGILAGCAVGGAVWAYLAGWLYVKRGVEVVISTILLNFVALQLLGWAVSGPLQEGKGQLPLTDLLPDAVMLPRFDRQTDLHAGVFLAIVMAFIVWGFLYFTKAGFRLRVVGDNAQVARANRIDAKRMQLVAMLISGALCGLAGGVEYTGTAGQLGSGFSQQWGFIGIPVALLGGLHPLLVMLSAGYFGALFAGSENLARFTPAGTTLIYVIQAAAVLGFVGVRALMRRKPLPTEAA
ncbi:ABC transporter permease [Fimbriimonas ginsengisoli]|uniref:ABC transporter permease n=1 Tax=Fimbriimonas ginsengisoli TaxID=1005039 RepID=UPI0003E96FBF|nr:ABC transporter permease [Fimbriimonas ginsengisoli]